jgi:hypothetical protein
MENQDYHYHSHHRNHNNTKLDVGINVNIPLLVTILITFVIFILFLLLFFLILYTIKNYSKIYICSNSPCKRNKRKKGIEIELGNLSHKIIYDKKIINQ